MPRTKQTAKKNQIMHSPSPSSSSSAQEETRSNSSEEERRDDEETMEIVDPQPIPQRKKSKKAEKSKKGAEKGKKSKPQLKNPMKHHATKKKKNYSSYKIFIYKVLKQVHMHNTISTKAMTTMNDFMNDVFEKIAKEAAALCKKEKKKTLSAKDIESAVKLLLPGELAKHAVSEGLKAIINYKNSY